jgi:hypothetical protein
MRSRFPGAMQRATLLCRTGIVANAYLVMRGLDPRIHPSSQTSFEEPLVMRGLDPRIHPSSQTFFEE